MSQLPPAAWAAAAVVAVLLLALLGASVYAVLRRSARDRIARLPGRVVAGGTALAAVPWLVVWLAPIAVKVEIHGVGPLLGWLALALLAFGLLVPVPLAALLAAAVWLLARRHGRAASRRSA